jgi:acylphosphatase
MPSSSNSHDGEVKAVRARIAGRVQGVGFRAWTERNALSLGLSGWVRNRRDGSVEAVFQGPSEAVDKMLKRCRRGPSSAAVTNIEVADEAAPHCLGFAVHPTA